MDVRMPVMDGIEATRRILAGPSAYPKVLVLTTFDLDEYVFDALLATSSSGSPAGCPGTRATAGACSATRR